MTVAELIAKLQAFPPATEVFRPSEEGVDLEPLTEVENIFVLGEGWGASHVPASSPQAVRGALLR